MSPTEGESGRRSAEVAHQLRRWSQKIRTGVGFDSSTGFHLTDGSVLSPDASWMQRERWEVLSEDEREGFVPVCPDAVFEIRSRTQRLQELREKMGAYLRNGARAAILIDPYAASVEVYRPGSEPQLYPNAQCVPLDPELPGFELDLLPVLGE